MNLHWSVVLLIVVAIFVVPTLLGNWLARRLRMNDYGWKIAVALGAFAGGLAISVLGWPPLLGYDLSGGVNMVYEVDEEKLDQGESVDMDQLINAIAMRLNPGGVKEITIRPFGQDQIEIIVPRVATDDEELAQEEAERIRKIITDIGSLEFRIVANRRDARHETLIAQAEKLPRTLSDVTNSDGNVTARFVPVQAVDEASRFAGNELQYLTREGLNGQTEVLVVMDPYSVTGEYLLRARPGYDQQGRPAVHFAFDAIGARKFSQLTSDNLPDDVGDLRRELAIILDGELHSAPYIRSVISDQGEIEGDFTEQEVGDLCAVLNAGALPAALRKEPISSNITGPTLGRDQIRKGAIAMAFSVALVMVVMLVYYRFAGVVACLMLMLNIVLILACMIAIKAALTLAGIAGLVLGVGMAVDANVLIYERIREERDRGTALRMAIVNGFQRATRTIIDANLTTLITALVLYVIGTDTVKGFAVTLILGLLMNLFTAVFCARIVFDIAERRGWLKKLSMMRLLDKTDINFVSMTRLAAFASVIAIGIGIAGVASRGQGILDIDFTGGVSVQARFHEPQRIEDVRLAVESRPEELPDVVVADLQLEDEPAGLQFVINTSQKDVGQVETTLYDLFGEKLVTNDLQILDSESIASTEATDDASDETSALPADGDQDLLAQADAAAADDAPSADADEQPESDADASVDETTDEQAHDAIADDAETSETGGTPAADDAGEVSDTEAIEQAAAEAKAQLAQETIEAYRSLFPGGTQATIELSRRVSFSTLDGVLSGVLGDEIEYKFLAPEEPGLDQTSEMPFSNWVVFLDLSPDAATEQLERIRLEFASEPFFPSSSEIGSRVAGGMREQAIAALVASQLFIIIYIWIRFQKVVYGLAAVIAVVHDVLITLGIVALSLWLAGPLGFLMVDAFKISLATVAAFLTLIGYSLNDTIVVFDRIREVKGKSPHLTPQIVNRSVNETLSRTIMTALTTLVVLAVLYVRGGTGIHAFTFVMFVGVVVGTYSSIFIASPVLLWLSRSPATAEKPATSSSMKAAL